MLKYFRQSSIWVLLIMLQACGSGGKVEQREEYWSHSVSEYFQEKHTINDLHSWLREKGIFYTFDASDIVNGKWSQGLENINVSSFVCESWSIILTVEINKNSVIENYQVGKVDRCL